MWHMSKVRFIITVALAAVIGFASEMCLDKWQGVVSAEVETPLAAEIESPAATPLQDQGLVFTGKMSRGTRGQMQALARDLGARVQTSVSGATDILVCGEKVGAKKLEQARRLGVRIISEAEFFQLADSN